MTWNEWIYAFECDANKLPYLGFPLLLLRFASFHFSVAAIAIVVVMELYQFEYGIQITRLYEVIVYLCQSL